MSTEEVLPAGVGRVPAWWMKITPHYTLDEEDEQARRMAEDQMAFYYMQLAAADDAGVLMPDGTPKLGLDLKPLAWTPLTPWSGRGAGAAEGASGMGPGGRNFKPGHPVIDPKLFGIMESDPDYKAYLTGAKLPPGYFEKMSELANSEAGGTEGILNNLKQTDYGRYGRQAESPNFKPSWAKKKLRSTTTGTSIRQGQYDDSPNKFSNRRRVEAVEKPAKIPSVDGDFLETPSVPPPSTTIFAQIQQNRFEPEKKKPEATQSADSEKGKKTKLVRKIRKVKKNDDEVSEQELKLKEQQEKLKRLQELQRQQQELLKAQAENEAVVLRQQQMQRAQSEERQKQEAKLQQLQALQRQQQALLVAQKEKEASAARQIKQRQDTGKLEQLRKVQQLQELQKQQQLQQQQQQQEEDEYDEESYEEEILEDDYTEGSYEEEVIEEEDDVNELNDLQAILAIKQAELQRLQAQM